MRAMPSSKGITPVHSPADRAPEPRDREVHRTEAVGGVPGRETRQVRIRAWTTSSLRDLGYDGAVFLWSIVAFTILVAGVSVTASLLVLVIGVFVWVGFAYIVRRTTWVDRRLAGWQRKERVRDVPVRVLRPVPQQQPGVARRPHLRQRRQPAGLPGPAAGPRRPDRLPPARIRVRRGRSAGCRACSRGSPRSASSSASVCSSRSSASSTWPPSRCCRRLSFFVASPALMVTVLGRRRRHERAVAQPGRDRGRGPGVRGALPRSPPGSSWRKPVGGHGDRDALGGLRQRRQPRPADRGLRPRRRRARRTHAADAAAGAAAARARRARPRGVRTPASRSPGRSAGRSPTR